MVEAITASNLPLVPIAIIDPAEFNIAERMLATAGCVKLKVATLNTSSSKVELLLIEKEPEKVTLKTGVFEETSAIVADSNTPLAGLIIRPCAGLINDHPAPARVMTRTEAANSAGMFTRFGIKVMLMVVEDSMALLINCTKGSPASMVIASCMISTNVPEALEKKMFLF
jgi:hypothetical protein